MLFVENYTNIIELVNKRMNFPANHHTIVNLFLSPWLMH